MAITELSPYRMCLILTTSQVVTAYLTFFLDIVFFSTVDSIGFLDKVRLAIEDV